MSDGPTREQTALRERDEARALTTQLAAVVRNNVPCSCIWAGGSHEPTRRTYYCGRCSALAVFDAKEKT